MSDAMLGEVRAFQEQTNLLVDGIVGHQTWRAILQALHGERAKIEMVRAPSFVPRLPSFSPLSPLQSVALFGDPRRGNPINEDGTFPPSHDFIPELHTVGMNWQVPGMRLVQVHREAERALLGVWQAWQDAGLIAKVKSWAGCVAFRVTRQDGSRRLSQHAYGAAFDINVPWNYFGHVPAMPWQEGSTMELVPIAHKFGWYWGGHFTGSADGMHFELADVG